MCWDLLLGLLWVSHLASALNQLSGPPGLGGMMVVIRHQNQSVNMHSLHHLSHLLLQHSSGLTLSFLPTHIVLSRCRRVQAGFLFLFLLLIASDSACHP